MQELFSFGPSIPFHLFRHTPSDGRKMQHWHSFYEIGYCYGVSGSFFIGERTLAVRPGDLMLFPPYEPHIAQSDKGYDDEE